MMQNDENLKKRALGMLSDKRRLHTEGVRKTAKELCEIYGADAGKTDLAVCCHDIYRGRQTEELDELIDRYDIPDRYKGNANLSHGKIAAAVMENEFGISDRQILDAVSYHTTGRAGMSVLEMIVFLADAIEPGRDYPLVGRLRELSVKDLDRACLESLEGTISFLEQQGVAGIDPDTLKARDWLAEKIKNSKTATINHD